MQIKNVFGFIIFYAKFLPKTIKHGINQGLLTTLAVFGIPGRIGTLPEIVEIFVAEIVSENQRSG